MDDEDLIRGNTVIHLNKKIGNRMLMFAPNEVASRPLISLGETPKTL